MSGLSVKQIKQILEAAGVDYSDCSEKHELDERLAKLRANPGIGSKRASGGGTAGGSASRGAGGAGGAGGARRPDRPSVSSSQGLGLNADGTDGGEGGAEIRRICACECYYQVLGVSKDADDAALKKAYRKTALKLHPDKCALNGADEAFKKVSAAFACLSDSEKRRSYNTWGTEDRSKMGANGFRGGGGGGDVDAEELFRAFFGEAAGRGGPRGAGMHFFNFGPGQGPDAAGRRRGGGGAAGGAAGGQARGNGGPDFLGGGAGGVVENLMRTFVNNPWTLLTAFVVLASLWSLIEAVLAMPYLMILPFVVPAEYRKHACIILLTLLTSGVLI